VVAALLASAAASGRGIQVGEPAPDFHAKTFDGRQISLADYKGRVLVINLWATWCALTPSLSLTLLRPPGCGGQARERECSQAENA
jgi:peroxiredoxin